VTSNAFGVHPGAATGPSCVHRGNRLKHERAAADEQFHPQVPGFLQMETILVVDSAARESLNTLLLRAGYQVHPAPDSSTLRALLARDRPSAVILALHNHTLATQETCLAIRRIAPDIPLVVLSPNTDIATKVGIFELGADDYIEEPFDPGELIARLRSVIRRWKLCVDQAHI
jgi:DNA-binding response OmpR family regulator